MTWFIDTTSKRRLPAKLAAGLAVVAAVLVLGAGVASARDDWHRGGDRGGHYGHWNGGYYGAPPVVYGGYAPGYYPPPVVYGPGIGIGLPGINLNIR